MLPLYDNNDVASKLKSLKKKGNIERSSAFGWLFALIFLFMARNAGYVTKVVTDIASIMTSTLAVLGFGGKNISNRNRPHLRRLAYDIKRTTNLECEIKSLDDIEIIPKNIQIGDNLEAVNAVPIFKEGHYIVINSSPAGFILQQVEVDGEKNVQILSPAETYEMADELAVENIFVEKNIKRLKKSFVTQKKTKGRI